MRVNRESLGRARALVFGVVIVLVLIAYALRRFRGV